MDASDRCRWDTSLADVGGRIALARSGEQAAARHLERDHGLVTIAQNLRVAVETLRGELDVVAEDRTRGLLVICEVKTRTTGPTRPGAVEVLAPRQRARIRRMAAVLLADGTLQARRVRFDLVTVDATPGRAVRTASCQHLAGAW
jgi:Holliday junction resolvase-like predicted endonuclease